MAIHDIRRAAKVDIKYNIREAFSWTGTVTNQDDSIPDLSASELVYTIRKTENGTAIAQLTVAGGEITKQGASSNVVTIAKNVISDLEERAYFHDLEDTTNNKMIFDGLLYAAYKAYNE